jgi:hypothetical protein
MTTRTKRTNSPGQMAAARKGGETTRQRLANDEEFRVDHRVKTAAGMARAAAKMMETAGAK